MAGYSVEKPIRAQGLDIIRNPGQQVSEAEFRDFPALLQALIDEGALKPIDATGLNALMSITGMRADWAATYYANGFRTVGEIANASVEELRKAKGVGVAVANDLKAAATAAGGDA